MYRLAAARGFATIGIVSAVADAEHAQFSAAVDTIYVVEDKDWGGRRPDGTLSPTSATMVGSADEMIAIGGGSIAREEIEAARTLGKTVRYAAADMDHASAIEKAGGRGEPAPEEVKGAVHRLFEDR